jgi:hypothetical protein
MIRPYRLGKVLGIVLWCAALWYVALWAYNMRSSWAQGTAPEPKRSPPAGDSATQPPAGNPSERLDRSRGVITPGRDVDPKMQITPPDPGPTSTPVIPPPGSPGGNPNVIPK